MPRFSIEGCELDLPRNLALVDTNVLVAFANSEDELHEQAEFFIETQDMFSLAVLPSVLVEACGLMAKRKLQSSVRFLLQWVLTPGNMIVLPSPHSPLEVRQVLSRNFAIMNARGIDFVDSHLMDAADVISAACGFKPYAPIVTFDTSDFLRRSAIGQPFSVYDMRDLSLVEFE